MNINPKPQTIDPNKIHVGDVILVAGGQDITSKVIRGVQKKLGFGESARWTHVAGSIGGWDLVEGQVPQSRVCNLQKDYVAKGLEIRVLRRKFENDDDRVKVALWWATMNNLGYDILQLLWFPLAIWLGPELLKKVNIFNSKKRLICSELITNGFYKQGYNLFDKPAGDILPADFDQPGLLNVIEDIWMK